MLFLFKISHISIFYFLLKNNKYISYAQNDKYVMKFLYNVNYMSTKNNHSPFSNSFPNPLTSERIPIVPGIKDGRGRSLAIPLTHSISPIFVTLKSSNVIPFVKRSLN